VVVEIGVYTFAELRDGAGGRALGPEQRLRNLLEEIELADEVGLDVFGGPTSPCRRPPSFSQRPP
jgi:hypothetical protein